MRTAGVLFDLFGTLVPPFRRQEHMEALRACSELLSIEFEVCHQRWAELFPQRVRGQFTTIGECFACILQDAGVNAATELLAKAEAAYELFTLTSLEASGATLDVLAQLRASGLRLGLVSNCAPDVPRVWGQTRFAPFFDACVFSCQVRAAKPALEIYAAALHALDLRPDETLYVGDGSDQELSGAARCGLRAVLLAADLSNTYDRQRLDVDDWAGPSICTLAEVLALAQANR